VDALIERRQQVLDDRLDLGLARCREIFLHVDLPDRISEVVVGPGYRAFPALALLWRAREGLAVEIEMQVVESLGQQRRVFIERVESQQGLPGTQRFARRQFRQARERR